MRLKAASLLATSAKIVSRLRIFDVCLDLALRIIPNLRLELPFT